MSRAYCHHEKKEFDQAIDDYTEVIKLDPKSVRAYYERGRLLKRTAKSSVDMYYAILRERNAEDPIAVAAAFSPLPVDPKLTRAIADFDEAIKLDPRFADAYRSRGSAFVELHDYDRAIKDFDEAIKLDPSNA